MPIFDYSCTDCNKTFEELFLSGTAPPDIVECHFCDEPAKKNGVQHFRHVGPVFEDLESYTNAFYSQKSQANGKQIRSYKDVQKFEQAQGLNRITQESPANVQYRERVREEEHEMSEVKRTDGRVGVADYIYKKEMQDSTGWSDSKYDKWKSAHDIAKSAVDSGKVDISQAATAKPPATS